PLTSTVASTGDGGSPPPMKVADWSPPQLPVTPMEPEPLNRLTKYPRASPSAVLQVPAVAAIARLVLKGNIPPAIAADVTVCSPTPCWFSVRYQPFWLEFGRTVVPLHEGLAVKSPNDDVESRFTACALSAGDADR